MSSFHFQIIALKNSHFEFSPSISQFWPVFRRATHIHMHVCRHKHTHIKYMHRNTCIPSWLLLPLLFEEKCLTKITKLQNAIFADQEVFRFDICKRKQRKKCNALDCTIIGYKSKCWRTPWHSKQTNPRYIINKAHIQTNHRPMITKVCHLAWQNEYLVRQLVLWA